jgi:hypothetical protein
MSKLNEQGIVNQINAMSAETFGIGLLIGLKENFIIDWIYHAI